jgi:formiminotetrahydrofolate cyclodeaminase
VKKLVEMNIKEFLDALASSSPTPGGGSVAALEGAFAAALVEMVTRLTIGREKFREHEELMIKSLEASYRLRAQMTDLVDMDTEAYKCVTEAYKLPKSTDEEKCRRSAAVQDGLRMATNIPSETVERASTLLEIIGNIRGKVNPSCNSDLEVAELSARAAAQGALLNVETNLLWIKDVDFIEFTKLRCAKFVKDGSV